MHIVLTFNAPATDVFDAWVVPETMKQWLFVRSDNRILEVTSEQRVGRAFFILEDKDGERIDHFGEYVRFERPTCVEFTLQVPKHFAGPRHMKVDLQDLGTDCELSLTQTGAGPSDAEEIWKGMLQGLKRVLEGKSATTADGA